MEATDETGTTITFWANADIFESVDYDFETIRARFQQMAFLNKGLTINLVDERVEQPEADAEDDLDELDDETPRSSVDEEGDNGHATSPDGEKKTVTAKKISYRYDDGLVDYVNHLNGSKRSEPVHPEVISIEVEDTERSLSLELAMQWTNGYSESVHTYANTINTHEGGTHEEGFRAAMTKLINDFARKQNLLKEKDENLTGDDVREGLTAVISVKLGEPQFEGQTKTKLGNSEVKGFVQRAMTDEFGHWLERPPQRGQGHRPQVGPGRGGAHGRPQGARGDPPQGPARVGRPARQAQGLPEQGPEHLRGLHRRGRLAPAARPRRRATRTPRRSCRSAARSSTSRRRASTRSSPTTRSRRSSRRSARASARTSTSTRPATTRSS